jgi:hypothetical protein
MWVCIGFILGLYWVYIGFMWVNMGLYGVYIGFIWV